jgi:hypothetical protein
MVLVAVTALATWPAAAGVRVWRDPDGRVLCHIHRFPASGNLAGYTHVSDGNSWPRYRRAVLGQPCPGDFRCPCEEELRRKIRARFDVTHSTADQKEYLDRMERLGREMNPRCSMRPVRPVAGGLASRVG